ncbi:hypothetical protein ACRAWG_23745 [Methylobacterium sp. P31]
MLRHTATATLTLIALVLVVTGQARAAAVTQPGEQVGLVPGLPLPEGFYAFDTFSWSRADRRDAAEVGVNIPFLIYASPLKVLGAQIEPVVAFPSVFINTHNPAPIPNKDLSTFYTPFLGNIFAWNLGMVSRASATPRFAGNPLVNQWVNVRPALLPTVRTDVAFRALSQSLSQRGPYGDDPKA